MAGPEERDVWQGWMLEALPIPARRLLICAARGGRGWRGRHDVLRMDLGRARRKAGGWWPGGWGGRWLVCALPPCRLAALPLRGARCFQIPRLDLIGLL